MTAKPLARIYRGTPRNLAYLARRLRDGELVGVPTETVYGLAANALDPRACRAIFRAKGRPTTDPLIVHIHGLAQLEQIAETNPEALALARRFWPGPLTLVLPKRSIVPDLVSAGLPSVAVRMPAHPLFRRLLKQSGLPLAAPSANPFGYVSPTTADHVRAGLGTKIRHILDGGPSKIGVESTILDLRNTRRPQVLRPGAVTRTQLEEALRRPVKQKQKRPTSGALLAPGLMSRHYSPRTPAELHARLPAASLAAKRVDEAWIYFRRPDAPPPYAKNIFWLDERGRLESAAHRLFAVLRSVDQQKFRRIHLERATGTGLADAINDRLQRAASR